MLFVSVFFDSIIQTENIDKERLIEPTTENKKK